MVARIHWTFPPHGSFPLALRLRARRADSKIACSCAPASIIIPRGLSTPAARNPSPEASECGAVPADLGDVYAIERRYWQSLWHITP